jgi:shikimate kinase
MSLLCAVDATFDGMGKEEFESLLLKRIKAHPNAEKKLKKRPLLADLKAAKKLYNERRPEYLKLADIVIDVTDKSAKECAKELLKKVKKHG